MSSIYFLKCLGFDDIYQTNDKQLKIEHKLIHDDYDNCYWDDLVCNMKNLIGLKMDDHDNTENISPKNVMSLVIECVKSLIKLKMALSIDLLILSCVYANYCNNYDFFNVLQCCIIECLNGNDNNYKTRNYQWFKHFILNSNVWLVQIPNNPKNNNMRKDEQKTEQKTTSENTGDTAERTIILFDTIAVDVNKLLMKQKEYIWNNVKQIKNEKESQIIFEKLCNFDVNKVKHTTATKTDVRQDAIENGITSNVNEFELLLQKVEMGSSAYSSFDVKFENNTKSYLTQCLAFAHANNNTLQTEMKKYFDNTIGIKCQYQSAPVKLSDRCIVKATSDYGGKKYPSCANILDFLRFSVTFDNVNDLLNGLNTFVNDINKGNVIECLLPDSVMRVKNGFNDILRKWNSVNDASYVDIKLNIIYINKNTNQSMIIEAQFLLSFLLKAKKMGHKYYSIVRQSELINNIKNQVYEIDNNYNNYNKKIVELANNHDSGALMKQLFWKPHVVLSMIVHGRDYVRQKDSFYPLFSEISKEFNDISVKFILFCLNCLFFHSFVMLDEPDDESNKFLKLYFNWGKARYTMNNFHNDSFYHIPLSSIVPSSTESSIVNLILTKKYLNVFRFHGQRNVCFVFGCVWCN